MSLEYKARKILKLLFDIKKPYVNINNYLFCMAILIIFNISSQAKYTSGEQMLWVMISFILLNMLFKFEFEGYFQLCFIIGLLGVFTFVAILFSSMLFTCMTFTYLIFGDRIIRLKNKNENSS
jgi:hypothetical protein